MGFLDKLKNMFTEEVEIDEPIKKDIIQVEIPSPRPKKEEKEEVIDDEEIKEEPKKEEKPFPIFFEDKDFNDLEKNDKIEKKYVSETSKRETRIYGGNIVKPGAVSETKKTFKPSPIISPVYGILDKNYHKEDIVDKPKSVSVNNKSMSYEDIRKKAYGTLEDDLENTLSKTLFYSEDVETVDIPADMDIFDELEAKISADKEEAIDFNLVDDQPVTMETFEESVAEDDKLSDSDLLNLIDTMYEKGDSDDVNDD